MKIGNKKELKRIAEEKSENCSSYQEEGIIKLLKDIRDGLAGGIIPRAPRRSDDDDDDDDDEQKRLSKL